LEVSSCLTIIFQEPLVNARPADPKFDTITKADISRQLADKMGVGLADAEELTTCFLNTIIHSLHRGETVELRGFGSFRLRTRKARTGRNPRTGTTIPVPAKRVAFFKPGKEIKTALSAKRS
jgi:integration host factor subunit beta